MRHYYLSVSIDNREVGIYPQSTNCKTFGNIQEFGLGVNRPVENIILPEIILENKSEFTNFLSNTAISRDVFLIINDDFLSLIKKHCNVNQYQYWKLNILHKEHTITNYNLFHLLYPSTECLINFNSSYFTVIDNKTGEKTKKSYLNYTKYIEDWNKLMYLGKTLAIESLYIDFRKIDSHLIRIANINTICIGYYVSERLKNAIEEQNFTGMAFQEIEEMDKRIKAIY
jgi:hypothetical protein